jgi:hypothetical protein
MKHNAIVGLMMITAIVSSTYYAPIEAKPQTSDSVSGVAASDTSAYTFSQNSSQLTNSTQELKNLADSVGLLLQNNELRSISIVGAASPDGAEELNAKLAQERAERVGSYLIDNTAAPRDIISISSIGEDWATLREMVVADDAMPYKAGILKIIDSSDDNKLRESRLRTIGYGHPWKYLVQNTFPGLRRTTVQLATDIHTISVVLADTVQAPAAPVDTIEEAELIEVVEPTPEAPFIPYWYLKTNVPALALLVINIAAEADLSQHWSVQLPVYLSMWNYFTSTHKVRVIGVQPEVRWWPFRHGENNHGLFVGAHAEIGWYNVAFGRNIRRQSTWRTRPSFGGGLNLGYRIGFGKNSRWSGEASIGAGVYRLDYQLFRNYINGLLIQHHQHTKFGIDQISLSLVYRIGKMPNKNQKGGE